MRNTTPLDALFPRIRRNLLAAAFRQPARWWYLSELAADLRTTLSSLQREIASLVASGIFQKRQDGRRVYVRAAAGAAIFADLCGLFRKTAGIVAELREGLRSADTAMEVAFVFGSVARGDERAESDIDVIVIGTATLTGLAPRVRQLEKRLGRPINLRVYSPEEYRRKVTEKNHFLLTIQRAPKAFLKGGPNDLDNLSR